MGSVRREPSRPSRLSQGRTSIQRLFAPSGEEWVSKDNASPPSHTQTTRVTDKELRGGEPPPQRSIRSRLCTRWRVATLVIIMLIIVAIIVSLVLTVGRKKGVMGASPVGPTKKGLIVTLADGQYQGVTQSDGVTSWLGMRYAAPPVGALRFAAPQSPPKFSGVHLANKYGPGCPGLGPSDGGSSVEDCLFIDVYAPTKATPTSKLPVYVFIQGGGFQGDDAHQNGTGLVRAADMNLVTVMMTYRGGSLGFLAGAEVQKGASLNNGLKDQRKALEWVQDNIIAFGGDPKHVTIGGASAGGGSVALHLSAYGGKDFGLFQAAAAESQSFAAVRTVAESQYQYNALVQRSHCNGTSDTLACLRSLDFATFQAGNLGDPFPGAPGKPIFAYNPTLDNDFITSYPFDAFAQGRYVKVPTIWGDDTNEGTVFTPRSITTRSMANDFLRDQFPLLSDTQLDRYNELYGFSAKASSVYWHSASKAYGETRYICPGIQLSDSMAKTGQTNVWNYRYNVLDPAQVAQGLGVPHTVEVAAIWGPDYVQAPASYYNTNKNIVPVIQGYWISFMRTFDPNKLRAKHTPEWTRWEVGRNNRIMLNANHTAMETVSKAQLTRCDFLRDISLSIRQ